MPFNEITRLSDAHSDYTDKRTALNHLDLLRLISSQRSKDTLYIPSSAQDKGKRPAFYQKNERALDEDGRFVPRTVELRSISTPEYPILPGGMWRGGDQSGMRRGTRAEDLARMSPSEQVDWCLRGGIVEAIGPLRNRMLAPYVMHMIQNNQIDSEVRCGIIKAVGSLGDRTVVPELMGMLHDTWGSSYVYGGIAKAVGSLGDRMVVAELMGMLHDTWGSSYVYGEIAKAVGSLGDRTVVAELMGMLHDAWGSSYVYGGIAKAVGSLGDRTVVAELMGMLRNNQIDPFMRCGIAKAIGSLGDKAVVPAMIKMLRNELPYIPRNSSLRGAISHAIGLLGDRTVIPELMVKLRDTHIDYSERCGIAKAIGLLGDRTVIPELMGMLRNNQINSEVRRNIAHALGSLGDRTVMPELMSILRNNQISPGALCGIAHAIGLLGDKTAIPAMMKILRNDQVIPEVNINVIRSVVSLGGKTVVPELMEVRSNRQIDSEVRKWIDNTIILLMNTINNLSSDASSSRNAVESRSSERSSFARVQDSLELYKRQGSERSQRNVPTTSSGEVSLSRNAGESRSPERSPSTDRPMDSRRSGREGHIGQQLGRYRLAHRLGQGGFADVYLGEHVHLKTRAAVKVLRTRLEDSNLEQFRKEARTLASLVHPHIVRILDFDVKDGVPFLVMEYAPHGTLRQTHPEGTRVPPMQVTAYVNQIADALDYAHRNKLMHRDIKPDNLLLGAESKLLLSDFGLVQSVQNTSSQITQGKIEGTIAYMAPEQIGGKPRPASDQYALGVVAYEWLSGNRPFRGSFMEIATQHMMSPPQPLHGKIPGIPREMEQVVFRALAKDPKDRFPDIKAFARAFEHACRDTSLSSKMAGKLRLK